MPSRVLVVEDEPALCQLMVKYLSRIGYDVHSALSGEEAWTALGTASFDIFVIDLSLPGRKGDDLASAILRLQPAARVILTSGYPVEMPEIGPPGSHVSFLLKPFSPDQLAAALRRIGGAP